MSIKSAPLVLCASAAAFMAANPAFAQDAEDDVVRLGAITVTAQRVEENLQDVPLSITTLGGEKLDNLKASGADVRFLSARAPSVIAESSFGRAFTFVALAIPISISIPRSRCRWCTIISLTKIPS